MRVRVRFLGVSLWLVLGLDVSVRFMGQDGSGLGQELDVRDTYGTKCLCTKRLGYEMFGSPLGARLRTGSITSWPQYEANSVLAERPSFWKVSTS